MPVLTAHYGDSPYKTCLHGDFLNLYGGGIGTVIFHRYHSTTTSLRSDMDPNMPKRLLRP